MPGRANANIFGFYPEKLSQWIVENVIIQKK